MRITPSCIEMFLNQVGRNKEIKLFYESINNLKGNEIHTEMNMRKALTYKNIEEVVIALARNPQVGIPIAGFFAAQGAGIALGAYAGYTRSEDTALVFSYGAAANMAASATLLSIIESYDAKKERNAKIMQGALTGIAIGAPLSAAEFSIGYAFGYCAKAIQ